MNTTKEVHERYLLCLSEMYLDNDRMGALPKRPFKYAVDHHISNNLGSILLKLGYVKTLPSGKYTWIGREPEDTMVLEILTFQRNMFKKEGKTPKYKQRAILNKEDIPEALKPMGNIIEELIDIILMAKRYEIPEDKWKEFTTDIYHRK